MPPSSILFHPGDCVITDPVIASDPKERGNLTRRFITRLLREAVVISSNSKNWPSFAGADCVGLLRSLRSIAMTI